MGSNHEFQCENPTVVAVILLWQKPEFLGYLHRLAFSEIILRTQFQSFNFCLIKLHGQTIKKVNLGLTCPRRENKLGLDWDFLC